MMLANLMLEELFYYAFLVSNSFLDALCLSLRSAIALLTFLAHRASSLGPFRLPLPCSCLWVPTMCPQARCVRTTQASQSWDSFLEWQLVLTCSKRSTHRLLLSSN